MPAPGSRGWRRPSTPAGERSPGPRSPPRPPGPSSPAPPEVPGPARRLDVNGEPLRRRIAPRRGDSVRLPVPGRWQPSPGHAWARSWLRAKVSSFPSRFFFRVVRLQAGLSKKWFLQSSLFPPVSHAFPRRYHGVVSGFEVESFITFPELALSRSADRAGYVSTRGLISARAGGTLESHFR